MNASRFILGIDPGLRSTGFGIIEQTGSMLAYVASGCIKTDDKGTLPERLKTIAEDLQSVINLHKPSSTSTRNRRFSWAKRAALQLPLPCSRARRSTSTQRCK